MLKYLKYIFLIFTLSTAQERDSVKIYFKDEVSPKVADVVQIDSLQYISCDELAEVLNGLYSYNSILKKGNIWLGNTRFQFTANSEFFTFFDTTKNSFTFAHTPFAIIFIDSLLFIEIETAVQQISKSTTIKIQLNPFIQIIAEKKSPPKEVEDKKKLDVAKKRLSEMQKLEAEKLKWMLDVIVIDPGHGGHDPGSIGVNGTLEKDVALGISAKLGRLIKQKLPEVEVLYTRTSDKFVELYKRGKFANEAKGKLFISIHCNSHEQKPSSPKGFEIYLLRPGKIAAAIRVAEKENEVVQLEENFSSRYQRITEDNFILLTLAQSGHLKQSEKFAEILEKEMSKKLETDSRGVKQAGFYVLVGASMPNVLVETGYLSNTGEEEVLSSQDGQQTIAKSIFEAIRLYKVMHENTMRGEI